MLLHAGLLLACLAVAPGPEPAQDQHGSGGTAPLAWNERAAEHLLNRAAFGGTSAQIAAAAAAKPEVFVDELMRARRPWTKVEPVLIRWEDFDLDPRGVPLAKSKYEGKTKKEIGKIMRLLRQQDREQFLALGDRWFGSMVRGDDPVRDHMTLFWHGFFTTSVTVVRRKYEVLNQFEFLRENSLGSFRDLLHGIARDPAMLQYLDNNTNVQGHANENLARELMELFSLGEGHYSETDVREAARALTGCTADPEGRFQFVAANHDAGEKIVLGVKGKLGVNELVDIILAQAACPRWVAFRILSYLEGVPPSEARLAAYARFLREQDYQIAPFLKRLFLDPEFYREEVLAARVQGPIEYVVGLCHKLGIEAPSNFVYSVTGDLGQSFFDPPTVKGWDGGVAWITNASLMGRGNVAGMLVGVFDGAEPAAEMQASVEQGMGDDGLSERVKVLTVERLRELAHSGKWKPQLDLVGALKLSGAKSDAEVAGWMLSSWLAIEPDPALKALLAEQLARERAAAGLGDTPLADGGAKSERILRRMAHLVFSLPEAQLS